MGAKIAGKRIARRIAKDISGVCSALEIVIVAWRNKVKSWHQIIIVLAQETAYVYLLKC